MKGIKPVIVPGAYIEGLSVGTKPLLDKVTEIFGGIQVVPSPIGTLHERACEIYYQLVGGRVNYARHDKEAIWNHDNIYYKSILGGEIWSQENPIMFVAHSFGALTIMYLQHLLEEDFFGHGTDNRWISCLVTLAAPMKGSDMAYTVELFDRKGEFIKNGLFMNYMFFPTVVADYYNVTNLKLPKENGSSYSSYINKIKNKDIYITDYMRDNISKLFGDGILKTYPNTYYISVIASTERLLQLPTRVYDLTYSNLNNSLLERDDKLHILNDGIANYKDQFVPDSEPSIISSVDEFLSLTSIEKGKWYQIDKLNCDHLGLLYWSYPGTSYNIDSRALSVYNKILKLMGKNKNINNINLEEYFIYLAKGFKIAQVIAQPFLHLGHREF